MLKKTVSESSVSNGGESVITADLPYMVDLRIEGQADMLMHRWNCQAVDAKAAAKKGSAAKKTDDVESYVYRMDDGTLGIPGEYLRMSIIGSAKYSQDPRSPRKSAMDLVKAGVICLTNLASLGVKQWDYLDTRRVVIQRSGVNRTRPAMKAGWRLDISLMISSPEYISPIFLRELVDRAGRLIGIGDFRPTFGRFAVTSWNVRQAG